MADISAATWTQTDADNDAASPEGAPEGMSPGGVNNVIRMMMGALKRAYVWSNVPTTTAGTTTAYTLSYDIAPAALVDGMAHVVAFNATCGAHPTLNINSLGAKPLHYYTGTAWAAVPSGFIKADMVCRVVYNDGAGTYRIVSFPSSVGAATEGGDNDFTGENSFADTVTMEAAAFNEAERVDVASATTCNIGAAASNYVRITGTTTITGLGTIDSGARRHVLFSGALTLTHNATSLILIGGANIATADGDTALFVSEGSGNWRCLHYQRVSGQPFALASVANSLGADVVLNNTGSYFTGPTVGQGTTGTWLATGTVTLRATQYGEAFDLKLWDGTTVIASTQAVWQADGAPLSDIGMPVSLSGVLASPAGNIRISVKCTTSTTAKIVFNASANSKDSTLSAVRIA